MFEKETVAFACMYEKQNKMKQNKKPKNQINPPTLSVKSSGLSPETTACYYVFGGTCMTHMRLSVEYISKTQLDAECNFSYSMFTI